LPWLPWNINNTNSQFSRAHLTTLNLNNLKIIEAMGIKLLYQGSLEWNYLDIKFNENLLSGSEVIVGGGGGAHTKTDGGFFKPTFIFGK
jgi:hypothetical protein